MLTKFASQKTLNKDTPRVYFALSTKKKLAIKPTK
jgi:hypothetical protein